MNDPKSNRVLSIDFETTSTVDLRKTGVFPYARHEDTKVLCMAYAFDNDPVQVWRWDQPFPADVAGHVQSGLPVRAWNAQFEFEIWNNTLARHVLLPALTRDQLFDTMAQAAYYGLPLGLDQSAEAAGLSLRKDKAGHALMMRMNKPRTKAKPGQPATWWHDDDPAKVDALCAYCAQDVQVERAMANRLAPLPPREREIWLLDQKINARGMGMDLKLIAALETVAANATRAINSALDRLTGGEVRTVGSTRAMLDYLKSLGWKGADLTKDTVARAIADPNTRDYVREVLQLRQDGAKTSTAKLPAMRLAATDAPFPVELLIEGDFPCVRGLLQHYGAFRTGRWAGRLVQPQNMPRPSLSQDELDLAIEIILGGCFDPETLELVFGVSAMELVSSLLRSVLTARPGCLLAVVDASQIEARVLPWLADEQKGLEVFRQGRDVYIAAAADIYRTPEESVSKDMRQIGKVGVLALGFGGAEGAFQTMAANYGVEVTDQRAGEIKDAWRAANPKIVQFWKDLDAAFLQCVRAHGQVLAVKVGHVKVGRVGAHVVIVLPSGRSLWYRDVQEGTNKFGQPCSTYMGVDQYTRQWKRLDTYGGKLAENVTQAVARDCLAEVMLSADKVNIAVLLTVHDELITEAAAGAEASTLTALEGFMSTPPTWAPGLPVGSDGWAGKRYRK